MSKIDQVTDWRVDDTPPVMTKRFTFESYEQTRSFVNALADLSKTTGYYPNLTFSQTQATVTIFTDNEKLGDDEFDFALETDKIREQSN